MVSIPPHIQCCPMRKKDAIPDDQHKNPKARRPGGFFKGAARLLSKPSDTPGTQAPGAPFEVVEQITGVVFDSSSALVLVLDSEGRCTRGSKACAQMFGCSQEAMRGQHFWELMNLPEGSALKEQIAAVVAKRAVITSEISFTNRQGSTCWLAWTLHPVVDARDQLVWVTASGVDLTERKQNERQHAAFAALAAGLRGELSVDRAYETILNSLYQFLKAEFAALAVYQPGDSAALFEKTLGTGAVGLAGKCLPLDEGWAAEFARAQKLSVRPAAQGDFPYLPPEQTSGLNSVVWVPLVPNGGPTALLLAASRACVSTAEMEAIAVMMDMAASAVNRLALLDETQRRLRRLSALSTINIAVSSSLDINVTLLILVNQITAQLGVDAADILLVDPVTRDLQCAAEHGFRSSDVSQTHVWMGQGHAGQVAMQHKSIHLYDAGGIADRFLPERRLHGDEFVAYHAVPLSIKGEIKGVLETFHRAPYQPDSEWPGFLESLAAETSIALNNAELLDSLRRNNLALALAYDTTIEGWALALEMRDRMTEDHTRRVAEQTLRLAQSLGIRGDELKYIRYGALLHDIGKIGIPDSILNKTGPLNEQEWEKMRMHPDYSRQMLASIPFLSPAMSIPYSHHERWDGSGYPQKLVGLQIPLPARIFAVVDVWDALSAGRVYRDALPESEVLTYLESEAGRLFDPDVVAAFVSLRRLSAGTEPKIAA